MPIVNRLVPEELETYKLSETDENTTIGTFVRDMLPVATGGIVLDVGAGLGDIGAFAFPDRAAVLIDIADFRHNGCKLHERRLVDFFACDPGDLPPIDLMLMSHVLQYIDDDVGRLNARVQLLNPKHLLVVCDIPDEFQLNVFSWFKQNGIAFNAEVPVAGFPPKAFRSVSRREFSGRIQTPDFATLADRLANLIFDASIDRVQCRMFARWLQEILPEPVVAIPQSVELFLNSERASV